MEAKAIAFNADLKAAMEITQEPNISTMTVLTQMNYGVYFDRVVAALPEPHIQDFITQVLGDPAALKLKRTAFHNSLIFKCKKLGVKIFCNGNLHITGVKSIEEAVEISDVFCTLMELIDGGTGLENTYTITDFTVQMINFYFKVPVSQPINLQGLKDYLKAHTSYYVSYNNERHAGVIVKMIPMTIIVFYNGNVLLSSITTGEHLITSFTFIKQELTKYLFRPEALLPAHDNGSGKTNAAVQYTILK
jgi:TATA-box binding protein (TBP) (component of TFIID and TFIIIB)